MFKNCTAYRVTPGFRFDADLLGRRPARDCGALETSSDGFTEPCEHSTAGLIHSVGGYQVIAWQTEDKILPGSVISDEVEERAEELEKSQGFKPGRKQMKDLKTQVIEDLLPKAFVQKRRTLAVLGGGYFIIDTSSPARADDFLEAIKLSHDTIPFKMVRPQSSAPNTVSSWMIGGETPESLSIDSDAVLTLPTEGKPQIHYARINLDDKDVIRRVSDGYRPTKIGLTFDARLSFVLNDKLQLTRLRWLDIVTLQVAEEAKDMQQLFDSEVLMSAAELVRLLDYLVECMGGEAEPADGDLFVDAVKQAAKTMDKMLREDGTTATISDGSGNVLASFGGAQEGGAA